VGTKMPGPDTSLSRIHLGVTCLIDAYKLLISPIVVAQKSLLCLGHHKLKCPNLVANWSKMVENWHKWAAKWAAYGQKLPIMADNDQTMTEMAETGRKWVVNGRNG